MIILITEVMLLLKGGLLTEGSPTCEALLPDSWVIETNRLHPFHRQTNGGQPSKAVKTNPITSVEV